MTKEFSINKINIIPYWALVSVFCISIIPIAVLCIKRDMPKLQGVLLVRKIKFLLYTDKNFSSHNDFIPFAAGIKSNNNKVIGELPACPGRISGTPHYATKIIVEKIVHDKDAYLKYEFSAVYKNWRR